MFVLMNSNNIVSFSGKRHTARSVTVMRYDCYANGFRFDSHLADFRFVFFLYFFSGLGVMFKGYSVKY